MSQQKVYKKGEFLFKEGDKQNQLIFIQSGGVNVCLIRGKKTIDLFQVGSNQILGEMGLFSKSTHFFLPWRRPKRKPSRFQPIP